MPAIASTARLLSDLLSVRAAALGDLRAYTFLDNGEQDGDHLTWQALDDRSRSIAAAIGEQVEPGARVLLLFPPGLEFVSALFGVFRARAIAVPAYPPAGTRSDRIATRLRGVIADAGIEIVLTTAAIAARADALAAVVPELRAVRWLAVEDVPDSAAPLVDGPAPNDVAFLQYTSGSTSAPRGVMVTHANLMHNLADSARFGHHDAASISVSWLPVNHDMGLIQGVLQPVFSGFSSWLMSPATFLQRPVRWLQAMDRLGATHSGGPNFAFDLCARRATPEDVDALDLRRWRVAFSGSEPIRPATIDLFSRTFARCGFRREAFRPAYGLAEATLLVTTTQPGEPPRVLDVDAASLRHGRVVPRESSAAGDGLATRVVGCGWTGETTTIVIVDPTTGRRCAPDEVGEIWVASGSVAGGYWRQPESSGATFAACLADTGDGPFLRTGDLGFVDEGQLFVTGRIKDVMIVRGLKHDPHDVEFTVERAHAAVRPGGCAAFSVDSGTEQIAVAVEVDLGPDAALQARRAALIEAVRAAVTSAHGLQLSTVVLLEPGVLPKTTSGKVQRYACREGLCAGRLPTVARWDAATAAWPLECSA